MLLFLLQCKLVSAIAYHEAVCLTLYAGVWLRFGMLYLLTNFYCSVN